MIECFATYGLYSGWVFHATRWYKTDCIILVDERVLEA